MGFNEADLVIAHALQTYGGYIVDTTPGPLVISFENALGKGKSVYGATMPWPPAISKHFRFVGPPPEVPLDTAHSVGTPVPN